MGNTIRTFIAVSLNLEIQQTIGQIQNYLKTFDCNIKWVKPQNAHLTLKFLGDIKLKKIDELKGVLADLFQNVKSIETELTELGAFPSIDHPKVLWAGLKDDDKRIAQLVGSLENRLGEIGYKKEKRAFGPHITIGRARSPKNVHLLSEAMLDYKMPTGLMQVIRNIILYKSTLTPKGSIYEILENFYFSKA